MQPRAVTVSVSLPGDMTAQTVVGIDVESADESVVKINTVQIPSGSKVPGGTLTGGFTVTPQGAGTTTITVTVTVGDDMATATMNVTVQG